MSERRKVVTTHMSRACMVVHSYYPTDPRVRREAEALLDDGWAVDVICLRDKGEQLIEVCAGACVYRIPVRRHRGSGFLIYMLEYLLFFCMASLRLTWQHLRQGYDVVQVHNMPDFLVFTALLPRLFGAHVVLDMHDLVPELYMSKFGGSAGHPIVRLSTWLERRSITFADRVITATEPLRTRLIARGVAPGRVITVLNSADPRLFRPSRRQHSKSDNKKNFTLMYHGGLFERVGLDVGIKAVDRLHTKIPGLRFQIYGAGEATEQLKQLIEDLDLGQVVWLGGWVPIDDIPKIIGTADLGIVPWRENPFTELAYPTKAFEYLVMGVPVVLGHTTAVADLFGDIPDMFFQPGDVDALATTILRLYQEPARLQRLLDMSRQAYAPYAWENQRAEYLALMHGLTKMQRTAADLESS